MNQKLDTHYTSKNMNIYIGMSDISVIYINKVSIISTAKSWMKTIKKLLN